MPDTAARHVSFELRPQRVEIQTPNGVVIVRLTRFGLEVRDADGTLFGSLDLDRPAADEPHCNHDDAATHIRPCLVCECGAVFGKSDWIEPAR